MIYVDKNQQKSTNVNRLQSHWYDVFSVLATLHIKLKPMSFNDIQERRTQFSSTELDFRLDFTLDTFEHFFSDIWFQKTQKILQIITVECHNI